MKKIKNILRLYGRMGRMDKGYLWNLAAIIVLNSLHPLNGVYFLYFVVNSLEMGRPLREVMLALCLMGTIEFLYFLIMRGLKTANRGKSMGLKNRLMLELQEKTASLPFQELEDPKITLAQKKALEIFYPTQAAYMDFQNVLNSVQGFLFSLLQILALSLALVRIHWALPLPLLALGITSLKLYTIASDKKFRVWDQELVEIGRKLSYFQEMATNFSYAKEVRLYSMGNWIVSKMKNLTASYMGGIRKSVLHFSLVGILSSLLLGAGTGGTMLLLGYLIWGGFIRAANFVSCVNVVRTFENSLVRAVETYMTIGQAASYLQAYWDYMDFVDLHAVQTAGTLAPLQGTASRQGELSFEHVSFRYPGAKDDTLKDISFTIRPGEKIALVGENGSGKTTLIKLLLRLYRPETGRILWNGQDIADLPYAGYMKDVTAVFQDFKILEDTARSNLCFTEVQREERMWEVLRQIGMEERVRALPQGLDSYLGKTMYEGGQELSGGEKQKLAIARVLLRDAKLVIMDEPTAMLSPKVEHEIYTHFSELVKGKSAVYISHRMSSCRFCDRIMVLAGGDICEEGSHKELMAKKGEYWRMYTAQAEFYAGMAK